jgi:hypothetical protein
VKAIALKSQYSMGKNMFSLKYFFSPLLPKFAKFFWPIIFSMASFELFCRIFGRLATVALFFLC